MEYRYELQLTPEGLPSVDEDPSAHLHIRHDDGQIYIVGNQAGLLQLAQCLVSLALVPDQPRGFHFHLEPEWFLDEDSTPVVISNEAVFRDK